MEKRINSSEIVQPDLLGDLRGSMVKTETKTIALSIQLNAVNDILVDIKKNASTIKEGVLNLGKTTTKDLDARAKAQKKANILAKDAIEAEKIKAKLIADYEKLESQREKRLQKLAIQEEKNHSKREKQYNKEIEKAREQDREYVKTSRLLNEMRNRYKDLAVQKMNGVKLTRDEQNEYRRLIPQIRQTDEALKKIDATGGQFQRSVGNYPKVINGFKNALGQLGLAFGAFQLAAGFGKTLVNFEEQAANMAKTLGVTVDEAKNLSRELANIDTRTSISDLQAIASIGGQLGIEANQVVAFTESIDKLNVALGDEFTGGAEEITTVLGGMRNVLTDIKTDNAADDLLKLGNALNYIGAKGSATSPVIADFASRISGIGIPLGLTSDEVIGLSATLQELNVNAERGGTAVGAILQRITRDTKGFAELAGMPVKKFENLLNTDLLGAFKEVTKGFSTLKGDAVTQSKVLEKLGLTGSGASEVFLKLGSSVDLLDTRVKQAGESLKNTDSITDEFNVKNNTLGATMDKLTKDFQKYVIGVDDSGKVTGALSGTLQFLHDNFDSIVFVAKELLTVFAIYKARVIALNVAQKLFGDGAGKINISLKQLVSNSKDAMASSSTLASSFKGGIWAVAIAAVFELGKAFIDVGSAAENARIEAESFRRAEEKASKISDRVYNREKKTIEDRLQKYKDLNKFNKYYKKEEIKIEEQVTKEISRRRDELQAQLIRYQNEQLQSQSTFNRYSKAYSKTETARIDGLVDGTRRAMEALDEYELSLKDEGEAQRVSTISVKGKTKAVKELNTQLKEQNEYLSNQNDLLHEIDQIKLEQQINDLDLNIEKSKEDALKRAELTGKVELEATRDLINERAILEKKALDDRINYEIDKVTEEYRLKSVEARKSIEDNRLELLAQENLTNDARLKIEADYKLKIEQLNYDDLQRKGDLELEIQKIKLNSANSQIEIEKKKNDEIEATTKELNDKQEEFAEATRVKIEKADDDARKKRFDEIIKWEELITAFFEKQIDKRIALLEKESDAHQKQQDFFRELAENGNINAQQSLAEEAKLQREADAEKEKLEKRKQYLQAVSAFMVSYTNKLEAGKTGTQALTEALAEKAVLESILNTIPAFKEGGTHEGGLMLVNDASGSRFREIIETPDGNLFSPTQRNVVIDAPKGTKIHTQNQWEELQNNMRSNDAFRNSNSLGGNIAGNSFDIAPLVKEMRSLKNLIKNQPDRSHEIEQMVTGILNFKITEKKGNTTRRIKHQYRS